MLIVPQDLILIKILLKKILTGLINSAQNYHPKIYRLKTYKTHFLNSYLVNHKRSGKTLDVYLSVFFFFFFFFLLPRNFVCSQTFSKNQKEKFLGGARIWCTRHIDWVTHTLVGPIVCEGCLCVRDPTSMPGTTYNFRLG